MKMLDFLCREAPEFSKIVKIQVPAECCGIKTVMIARPQGFNGADIFLKHQSCETHLGNFYDTIWKNWKNLWEKNSSVEQTSNVGCMCDFCGMFNEYAISNFGDKYKCFECRS